MTTKVQLISSYMWSIVDMVGLGTWYNIIRSVKVGLIISQYQDLSKFFNHMLNDFWAFIHSEIIFNNSGCKIATIDNQRREDF
jgi:hypothetical protein